MTIGRRLRIAGTPSGGINYHHSLGYIGKQWEQQKHEMAMDIRCGSLLLASASCLPFAPTQLFSFRLIASKHTEH